MARKPRIEYAGAVYHVMNRGDRGGKVFKDDLDYELFIKFQGRYKAVVVESLHMDHPQNLSAYIRETSKVAKRSTDRLAAEGLVTPKCEE